MIHDVWCYNIFLQPDKAVSNGFCKESRPCDRLSIGEDSCITIQFKTALFVNKKHGASNQPRSGKRCTGLRLISASFASQGALRHGCAYVNLSGYLHYLHRFA